MSHKGVVLLMNAYEKRVLKGLQLQHNKYCEKLGECELILNETFYTTQETIEVNQRIQRYNRILIRIENQIKLLKSKENEND